MSQKRHTKAANWKRGIDCTWKTFNEYPHLHVSKSKSSFSTNLFGRFPNTYR